MCSTALPATFVPGHVQLTRTTAERAWEGMSATSTEVSNSPTLQQSGVKGRPLRSGSSGPRSE